MQTPIFLTKLSEKSIIFIIDVGKKNFYFNYNSLRLKYSHIIIYQVQNFLSENFLLMNENILK
jgi:hypothetical protein